ncbi:alpha/beta-hydrolase [Pluteus cervinus]|uniref:Alpha/beta-hydrolase n=1 Tax=Pluteus cervinus TaxID=181527 RepID=A0ACD3AYI9_9AGAR|nr:alpha/beta-hydrolase [Pluteus cervinus]
MIEPATNPTAQQDQTTPKETRTFLQRARQFLIIFGAFYVALLVLLAIPVFQSHILYLHAVRLPLFAKYDAPEKYGLAPNKTLNFHLNTSDNEAIGAWFILSDRYYHSLPTIPTSVNDHITEAVRSHPTILFLHGNAATRAMPTRIRHYAGFTSRLSTNVLAIDYRGYADSTGSPSEAGLVRDARGAWDWLISQGTKEEDIILVGHSLGTGVASQLAAQFGREGIKPRGLVMLAPFSSIRELLNTYHIFGLFPLAKPLSMIPFGTNLLSLALIHKYDSLSVVPDIKTNVVISHAANDWEIPSTHSEALLEAFLDPYLPPVDIPSNPIGMNQAEWAAYTTQQTVRLSERNKLIKRTELQNFGTLQEFTDEGRKVVFVKSFEGGHNRPGTQEGVQDVIGRTLGLF